MSWDDSNYYKRALRDNEDLDDIPFTGKKKVVKKKPYIIETRHSRYPFGGGWQVRGKYETEQKARKAMDQLGKNTSTYRDAKKTVHVYGARKFDNSLMTIVVNINGEMYVEYRLLKKD
jgi:hypothetical protein